ncbi:hypothetical protein V6Z11_D07G109200 [Gossypium hirsutum]
MPLQNLEASLPQLRFGRNEEELRRHRGTWRSSRLFAVLVQGR